MSRASGSVPADRNTVDVDHASEKGTASVSSPSVPYPLTFALTPQDAYAIRKLCARLGLTASPSKTAKATPDASKPAGASASISVSDVKKSGKRASVDPQLNVALANAFHDAVLPLTSRTAIRAFLIAYMLQTTLHALIPGLTRRKSGRETVRALLSATAARVGLAVGAFAAVYRMVNYILTFARLRTLATLKQSSHGKNLLDHFVRLMHGEGLVPFVSVLAASPALHLLPAQTARQPSAATFPRKTLALDLFTKGLYHQVNVLRARRSSVVAWMPNWFDTALLYALGNGQLLWAFLFEADCFPKSYGDFILGRSSAYVPARPRDLPSSQAWPSRRVLVDHVALLSSPPDAFPAFNSSVRAQSNPTTAYAAINPVLDLAPAHPDHTQLLCAMLHPTQPSCRTNYLQYWATEWKQSAKFVAAFTAFFNLFKLRSWVRNPYRSLFRFITSVVQGATVISGSIASAWAFTCLFQHYLPPTVLPRARFFLNGFLSSVFIFAVPVARRAQLGLYVARLSMDSTWQILVKKRKVHNVQRGDVLLLTLGLAMLASLYEDAPHALNGYIRRVLSIVTGPRITGTSAALAGLPLDEQEDDEKRALR